MLIRSPLLVLPLLLAACGGGEEPVANAANAVQVLAEGPKLGGVDLFGRVRAGGERPFWTMDIAPGSITFAEKPGATPTDLYPVDPVVAQGGATWTTQNPAGEVVTIALRAEPCGGLPLTAQVRIGARELRGCAGQAQAR